MSTTMDTKHKSTTTEILERPWRTRTFEGVEYVALEDAESVLRILAEEVVALRNYQYEQTRTLSAVVEKLCDVVARSNPDIADAEIDEEELKGALNRTPLN